MTGEISGAMIKMREKGVLIYTISGSRNMSYVISKKQYLAPSEPRIQYEPILFEIEGVDVSRIDVSFGHPLYTTVADIVHLRNTGDTKRLIPVVPDGCMALVLNCKGENAYAYMCRTIDEIRKLEIEPDEYYVLIRFLPGVGYSLIKDPLDSINEIALSAETAISGGEQIVSILERETHLIERIRLISKVIRVQLINEPDKYLVRYCTERLFRTHGNIRVEKLAEETGFTARHIGKMFEKCVGVSPKLFSQIMRQQLSMTKIVEGSDKLLVDIAVDSGFFDHAHMNRMYKKLMHCSSGQFRKSRFSDINFDEIDYYVPTK